MTQKQQNMVINGSFVGVAAITWLFVRQVLDTIWGMARWPLPQDWPLMPPDLVGLVAAVVIFVILKKNAKVNEFLNDVIAELVKVTWPPKKETILSTGVVSIMIAICAMLLFGFDTLWGTVVKVLYQS